MSEGKCCVCDLKSESTSCNQCKIECCQACLRDHTKSCDDLKTHTYHMCDAHSSHHANQVFRYCVNCEDMLCKICLDEHTNHACIDLRDAFDNVRTNTEAVFMDLRERSNELSQIIHLLDECKTGIQYKEEDTSSQIEIKHNKINKDTIKQNIKKRLKGLNKMLLEAKSKLKVMFEKDVFLVVYLRRWLEVKKIINDFEEQEKKTKQDLRVDGDDLQKVLQIFLHSHSLMHPTSAVTNCDDMNESSPTDKKGDIGDFSGSPDVKSHQSSTEQLPPIPDITAEQLSSIAGKTRAETSSTDSQQTIEDSEGNNTCKKKELRKYFKTVDKFKPTNAIHLSSCSDNETLIPLAETNTSADANEQSGSSNGSSVNFDNENNCHGNKDNRSLDQAASLSSESFKDSNDVDGTTSGSQFSLHTRDYIGTSDNQLAAKAYAVQLPDMPQCETSSNGNALHGHSQISWTSVADYAKGDDAPEIRSSNKEEHGDMTQITSQLDGLSLKDGPSKTPAKSTKSTDLTGVSRTHPITQCSNRWCQKMLTDCAGMKKLIEDLNSKIKRNEKGNLFIKTTSSNVLQLVQNIEKVDTEIENIKLCRTDMEDSNQIVDDMECLLDIFIKTKKCFYNQTTLEKSMSKIRLTVENQLDAQIVSMAEWTDEQRNSSEAAMEELRNTLRLREGELKEQEMELRDLNVKLASVKQENDNLRQESFKMQKQLHRSNTTRKNEELSQQQLVQMKKEYILMKNERDSLSKSLEMCKDVLKVKDESIQSLTNEKDELQLRLAQIKQYATNIKGEKDSLSELLEKFRNVIKEKEKYIQSLTKEKDELQIRLSTMAGNQLTKGNANITDLSDPNRPMKIGDQFVELYDNEWTDAIECTQSVVSLYPDLKPDQIEEIVIRHLYKIVTVCYKECLLTSQEHLINIDKAVNDMLITVDNKDQNCPDVSKLSGFKELMEMRRQNAKHFADYLCQNKVMIERINLADWMYDQKNEDLTKLLLETPFFVKCVRLCWYMVIQDPVMHLDDEVIPDIKFDKNLYREYTCSGDTVEFGVWPTLFLHKDGPVLCKGVVQVYRELETMV